MQKRQLISQQLALPDAVSLLSKLSSGETSHFEIVKEYLDRLEIFQPQLHGATQIYREEALQQARMFPSGKLGGIPISVKETFAIEGEPLTAGSKKRKPTIPTADSAIVAKLKAAGAIIVARSNVPEFAMAPETDNLIWGKTHNPLNLDCTAGGSSGGEGALVGSGSTVLGVGSDIGGSIRIPAAFCGIVGFKPSSDAVDKTGTFPEKAGFSDSMLALGPLTRSVRDALLVYNVIAKKAIATPLPESISGLRLFHPEGYQKVLQYPEVSGAVGISQAILKEAGMVKTPMTFDDVDSLCLDYNKLIIHDFETPMHQMLTGKSEKKFGLVAEGLRQLSGNPHIHRFLYQMLVGMQLLRPSEKETSEIIDRIKQARSRYYQLLGEDGILLLPTVGTLAPPHGKMFAHLRTAGVIKIMKPTIFCNILDLPAISIPAWRHRHHSNGLVPSVMLACKPGAEHHLFAVASFLENRI